MAKKSKTSKKPKPAARGKKPAQKKKAARVPVRRQANLPGHEGIRDSKLDVFCEDIFDARKQMNKGRETEQESLAGALDRLKAMGHDSYTAHGVELHVSHGKDKIRARVIDETGVTGGGTARPGSTTADVDADLEAGADNDVDNAANEG